MRLVALLVLSVSCVCMAQRTTTARPDESERTFNAAESLLQAGKVADAAKSFEDVIRLKPDFAEAYFGLGVAYSELGRTKEAIEVLRSYVKLMPKSADGHAVLGILLLTGGRVSESQPELEQAVRLNPAQPEAVKALGRVYNLLGDPAKTVPLLRPLVQSRAADDEARTILARAHFSTGDLAGASALLDQMIAANPRSSTQIYTLAALAARDSKDIPKTVEICEKGMRANPNSESLEKMYISLPAEALIDRTTRRLEELRSKPRDVDEMVAVGRILVASDKDRNRGTLEPGKMLLSRAIELAPDNAAAWYHLGRGLQTEAKMDEASDAFTKAHSFARDDEMRVRSLSRIGICQARLEHFEAAEKAFRASMELNRKLAQRLPEAAFDYYYFLVVRERKQEWAALLDEILHWDPLYTAALLERAKYFVAEDQPAKAIEDATLVAQNADEPKVLRSAHFLLVKAYHMLGKDEAAEVHSEWIKSHQ